ncbi:uncharacterized protein E0L32_001321 [Thyridium curvatum]|uniref:Heterokaryon incompatibility domain-containing protein n=1 Tax=Thyridium curvatum TaxID=1093900 RepID=A0A507AUF4_9PEZI|nr:uncharacterized protein E0L32_001321 [Thyridium curvatum]TPX10124.1 hypothetical protein E0L32_001321 [Thyridium curvatum]
MRILFIEGTNPPNVRLIENANELDSQPYVCLSHRWLPETEMAKLYRKDSEAFQKRIPVERLYPLVQDAVEATVRLGFRYLWVDCFCIYQDHDDLRDWHIQAAQMGQIYENAILTISALSCDVTSQNKRIFRRSIPHQRFRPVGVRRPDENTVWCKDELHPVDPTRPEDMNPCDEFPLMRRGWVYQERLLSRRTIYFTDTELLWECDAAWWCECQGLEHILKMKRNGWHKLRDVPWTSLVKDYTKTDLSQPSDRLPALSGIASRIAKTCGWTYIAGIWLEDSSLQLMWTGFGDIRPRTTPRNLPSWSWATANQAVHFLPRAAKPLITIVSHAVVDGANPYGAPLSATLVLKGPCLHATLVYPEKGASYVEVPSYVVVKKVRNSPQIIVENMMVSMRPDFLLTEQGGDFIASGEEVLLMVYDIEKAADGLNACGWTGLVLKRVHGCSTAEFERIGCVLEFYSSMSEMEVLEQALVVQDVTIV